MFKHLIFDFGGVFLDLGGKHSGIPANLSKIFNISEEQATAIWKENRVKLLTGKETPKEFLTWMNSKLGTTIDTHEAHETWRKFNKMEKEHINWELVDYVEKLKKNYKIHMLTDTIDLDNGASEWIGSITKHFDNIYKSYEIGHRKPNKEPFLHVLEKINTKPEDCVFVDDFQANIDAANELGIKGIFFTTINQLKKDFNSLGIA